MPGVQLRNFDKHTSAGKVKELSSKIGVEQKSW